jgi:hypothetical protein
VVGWQHLAVPHQSISLSLRDWLFIDGQMDNTADLAVEDGDDEVAERAHGIREVGWEATGHITRPLAAAGCWPPDDETMNQQVSVSLTGEDWRFVVDQLLDDSRVAESIGHADEAAWARALADRLAAQLADRRT